MTPQQRAESIVRSRQWKPANYDDCLVDEEYLKAMIAEAIIAATTAERTAIVDLVESDDFPREQVWEACDELDAYTKGLVAAIRSRA